MQHPMDIPLVRFRRERRPASRTRVLVAATVLIALVAGAITWNSSHSSTLPVSSEWTTKQLPELGIQFSYPASWHLQSFDQDLGMTSFVGALVSNVDHDFEHPVDHETSAFDMRGLPTGLIVISFEQMDHLNLGGKETVGFPLDLDRALTSDDTLYGIAFGGPQPRYTLGFGVKGHLASAVQIHIGEVTADERAVLDVILASVKPLS